MVQLGDGYWKWWALVTGVVQSRSQDTINALLLLDVTQPVPWGRFTTQEWARSSAKVRYFKRRPCPQDRLCHRNTHFSSLLTWLIRPTDEAGKWELK